MVRGGLVDMPMPGPPLDVVYFAVHTADRFGIAPCDVSTLYVHGDADVSPLVPDLESAFGARVRDLNPWSVVHGGSSPRVDGGRDGCP